MFKIELQKPVKIKGLCEDDIRELLAALEVVLINKNESFVTAANGLQVKFLGGQSGNFSGAVAKLGGQSVEILPGFGSSQLGIFKGGVTSTNPGPGWKVEFELTQKFFSQSSSEASWEIFLASRSAVINE